MVKLLNLILLCFITVAACSPVSSNDEGDFGESLERREIEEAYQILQSKLYGRIERSCIVCVGKAVAIDDKEVNRQFIESIFDLEGRAYVKYYDKNLKAVSLKEFGGAGIPRNEIDGVCTGLMKDLMMETVEVIERGLAPSPYLKKFTPYVKSEAFKRYRAELESKDTYSCLNIALSNDSLS